MNLDNQVWKSYVWYEGKCFLYPRLNGTLIHTKALSGEKKQSHGSLIGNQVKGASWYIRRVGFLTIRIFVVLCWLPENFHKRMTTNNQHYWR